MGSFFDDDDLDAALASIPIDQVTQPFVNLPVSQTSNQPNQTALPAKPSSFSSTVSYTTWHPKQPPASNVFQPVNQVVNRPNPNNQWSNPTNTESKESDYTSKYQSSYQSSSQSKPQLESQSSYHSKYPSTSSYQPSNQSTYQSPYQAKQAPVTTTNYQTTPQTIYQHNYDKPSRFTEYEEKTDDQFDDDYETADQSSKYESKPTTNHSTIQPPSKPVDNSAFTSEYLWSQWKALKMSSQTNEILYILLKRELEQLSGAVAPGQGYNQTSKHAPTQSGTNSITQSGEQVEHNLRELFRVYIRFMKRAELPCATNELLPQTPVPLDESLISSDLLECLAIAAYDTSLYLINLHHVPYVKWSMKLSLVAFVLFLYSPVSQKAKERARNSATICITCIMELGARETHEDRLESAKMMTSVCASALALGECGQLSFFDSISVQAHMLETKAKLEIDEQQRKKKRRRVAANDERDMLTVALTSHLSICFVTWRTTNFYHQLIAFAVWLGLESIAAFILECFMDHHTVIGYEHRLYRILVDDDKCYQHCTRLIDDNGAWLKAIKYDANHEQAFLFQDAWNRAVILWSYGNLELAMKLLEVSILMAELIAEIHTNTTTGLKLTQQHVEKMKDRLHQCRRAKADADAKQMLREEKESEQERLDDENENFDSDAESLDRHIDHDDDDDDDDEM